REDDAGSLCKHRRSIRKARIQMRANKEKQHLRKTTSSVAAEYNRTRQLVKQRERESRYWKARPQNA
ncbi:MAG TPA: hypothetical protein VGQ81_04880, partial [Acidobacteriota bacterium]|nr:hypothetical protein [Acidobacteriota bacterium]